MAKAEGTTVVQKPKRAKELTYDPELVMVRALRRGWYGYQAVVEAKYRDDAGRIRTKRELGRDALLRNEGDVFEMDTADMRKWPLDPTPASEMKRMGERLHIGQESGGPEIIKIGERQFELPSWTTLADGEDETAPTGHIKEFGNRSS